MGQPQEKFAVTRIVDGKQTLVADGLSFYTAYSMVVDARATVRELGAEFFDFWESPYPYYRMGKPHK